MLDVSSFSFQPRRLWRLISIGTTVNDPGHVLAEFFPDIAQSFRPTAIFHSIMKKRADRFGFIGAVLKRDSRDAKNMRDVRNPRFLARLITMRSSRINQRFLKLRGKVHVNRSLFESCFRQTVYEYRISAYADDGEREIGGKSATNRFCQVPR